MPKITRTRYGGVWPSSSAESDGTIYALDGVDADVSDASLRPMRAPRLVSTETGESLFVEDCVLLANTKRVFTAHNSVGGNVLFRTGVNGYPEVAYDMTPASTGVTAILLPGPLADPPALPPRAPAPPPPPAPAPPPAAPLVRDPSVTLVRRTLNNQPFSNGVSFDGLALNTDVAADGAVITFSHTAGLSDPYNTAQGFRATVTGGAVVTGSYPTYTLTTFPPGSTVAFAGSFDVAAAGLNTLTMTLTPPAGFVDSVLSNNTATASAVSTSPGVVP